MESLFAAMSLLVSTLVVTVPMKQILFLVAISIFFILMGRFKSALVANFVFIFYWTCILSKSSSGTFTIDNIVPFASSYTVIASAIFFGVALMIFYAISE